jgi:hypothetical protein
MIMMMGEGIRGGGRSNYTPTNGRPGLAYQSPSQQTRTTTDLSRLSRLFWKILDNRNRLNSKSIFAAYNHRKTIQQKALSRSKMHCEDAY